MSDTNQDTVPVKPIASDDAWHEGRSYADGRSELNHAVVQVNRMFELVEPRRTDMLTRASGGDYGEVVKVVVSLYLDRMLSDELNNITRRDHTSDVKAFLREHCVVNHLEGEMPARAFYRASASWCAARGDAPMTETAFGRRASKLMLRLPTSKGRVYRGVRVLEAR